MRRRGPMQLDLSPREQEVLAAVGRFRLMSAGQIERLAFAGHHQTPLATRRRCQASLRHLVDLGLLDRLDRRRGGHRAGSEGFTYRLSAQGRRIAGLGGRGGRGQPSAHWTDHALACTEVAIKLHDAERWGELAHQRTTPEPDCWRRFTGTFGAVETLKPDLLAELVTRERRELRWFVEVDRDTEHLPTVLRKCQQYQAYWQAGVEDHPVFPRVLWSVPDERRADAIERAVARPADFEPGLFAVATAERTTAVLLGQPINEQKGGEP